MSTVTNSDDKFSAYLTFNQHRAYWITVFGKSADALMRANSAALYCTLYPNGSENTSAWAEKSTSNIWDAPKLFKHFPNAHVVQIIRHPAAVIASRKLKLEKKSKPFHLMEMIYYLRSARLVP